MGNLGSSQSQVGEDDKDDNALLFTLFVLQLPNAAITHIPQISVVLRVHLILEALGSY